MSGIEYKPLAPKKNPIVRSASTPENMWWKSFRNLNETRLSGPINHIAFSAAAPHHFAVSSGTNVVLYSGETRQRIKSFSRFMDIAYSGNFRQDGKLLAAGDEKGNVKLFDVETKTMLRQVQPHASAVHAVDFLSTTQLLSGSDDRTLCLYDISTNMVVNTYQGHNDYVRSISVGLSQSDLFLSGGFDACVKVWDQRLPVSEACVMTLPTPHAVSCILQLSSSVVVAASDNELVVFDILNNGKQLERLNYHQKQITSMALYKGSSARMVRFLTSSLDGMVRVINPVTFKVTHNFKFPDPVLSVAISPGNVLAVGTSTGILSTRMRPHKEKEEAQPAMEPGALVKQVETQSKRVTPDMEAKKVEVKLDKRQHLAEWDLYLRKFEYKKALSAALEKRDSKSIIALLEELRSRGDLKTAIRGRTDKELEPLISFVAYYITDPKYNGILNSVANEIMDHYAQSVGKSSLIDSQLVKLERTLKEEIQLEQDVFSVMGMLEAIMANNPE